MSAAAGRSDPFQEGYLAAAASRRFGALRRIAACPYPRDWPAAAVWHSGVGEFLHDYLADMVPVGRLV